MVDDQFRYRRRTWREARREDVGTPRRSLHRPLVVMPVGRFYFYWAQAAWLGGIVGYVIGLLMGRGW